MLFDSALPYVLRALPVQERMEGRGSRGRNPENQKWKEGKEGFKGGRGSVMGRVKPTLQNEMLMGEKPRLCFS